MSKPDLLNEADVKSRSYLFAYAGVFMNVVVGIWRGFRDTLPTCAFIAVTII